MENQIYLKFSRKQVYITGAAILFANMAVLAATYQLYHTSWTNYSYFFHFLKLFDLAHENTFATCYSSWLLLTVAVVSALCFVADRQYYKPPGKNYVSYGWLFFSFVFGLLSLDEIGSFHERVGHKATFFLFGELADWYLFLAVIYSVAIFMVIFCWQRLRQNLWSAAFFLLGLLFFLSLRFQEAYEMAYHTNGRPVKFTLLEEGSEIFGSFCFLIALTLSLISMRDKPAQLATGILINLKFKLIKRWALGGTFLLLFVFCCSQLFIQEYFKGFAPGDKGIPKNWFPGAVAYLGGLIALVIYFNQAGKPAVKPIAYLFTGLFCLALSFVFGGNFYGKFLEVYPHWFSQIIRIGLAASTIILGFYLMLISNSILPRAGLLLWIILLGISSQLGGAYTAETGFAAFTALLLVLVQHFYQGQEQLHTKSPLKPLKI
jgi:hypothetical protein